VELKRKNKILTIARWEHRARLRRACLHKNCGIEIQRFMVIFVNRRFANIILPACRQACVSSVSPWWIFCFFLCRP
jgi:hypothetical protein